MVVRVVRCVRGKGLLHFPSHGVGDGQHVLVRALPLQRIAAYMHLYICTPPQPREERPKKKKMKKMTKGRHGWSARWPKQAAAPLRLGGGVGWGGVPGEDLVRRGLHQGDELGQARVHDVLRVAQVPLLGVLRDGHVQRNLPTIAIKITRKTAHARAQVSTGYPPPPPHTNDGSRWRRWRDAPPTVNTIYIYIYICIYKLGSPGERSYPETGGGICGDEGLEVQVPPQNVHLRTCVAATCPTPPTQPGRNDTTDDTTNDQRHTAP